MVRCEYAPSADNNTRRTVCGLKFREGATSRFSVHATTVPCDITRVCVRILRDVVFVRSRRVGSAGGETINSTAVDCSIVFPQAHHHASAVRMQIVLAGNSGRTKKRLCPPTAVRTTNAYVSKRYE